MYGKKTVFSQDFFNPFRTRGGGYTVPPSRLAHTGAEIFRVVQRTPPPAVPHTTTHTPVLEGLIHMGLNESAHI